MMTKSWWCQEVSTKKHPMITRSGKRVLFCEVKPLVIVGNTRSPTDHHVIVCDCRIFLVLCIYSQFAGPAQCVCSLLPHFESWPTMHRNVDFDTTIENFICLILLLTMHYAGTLRFSDLVTVNAWNLFRWSHQFEVYHLLSTMNWRCQWEIYLLYKESPQNEKASWVK